MNFKYYYRKSSFKKDIASAKILLEQIEIYKPKNFLEVGVFQGVTSKNVCGSTATMSINHYWNFA